VRVSDGLQLAAARFEAGADRSQTERRRGKPIMRKLLSLIALFGVIAIADIALSPSANATVLTTGVHALKAEQAGVVEKTAVRCWWRNGRRICRW
jgi:hypothetical protein